MPRAYILCFTALRWPSMRVVQHTLAHGWFALALFTLASLLCLGQASVAFADPLPPSVAKAIEQAGIAPKNVALFAQRIDQAAPVLSHNATQAMNPASVMKLVTSYAGLSMLGADYRWKTEFLVDTMPVNGRLKGNLYIRGHGDPSLDSRTLWRLLGELKQQGIHTIQGNVVIDDSLFAPTQTDPFAFDGEGWRAYNATAHATLLDQRATSIGFNTREGQVQVTVFPRPPTLQIQNHLRAESRPCDHWREQIRYEVSTQGKQTVLALYGSFSSECGERFLDLTLYNQTQQWAQQFKPLWSQWGGALKGQIIAGSTPEQALVFKTHRSESLATVMRDLNKYSQNLMARQLLLSLALEQGHTPANEQNAAETIHQWLTEQQLQDTQLVVDNGAGLSRQSQLTAAWLAKLLIHAYQSPTMPEFVSSLPVYAQDGTLARRAKTSPLAGRAHLKSGSIEGVNALAGYILDANQHTWAVVWLVNDSHAAASADAQEAFLHWVFQATPQ